MATLVQSYTQQTSTAAMIHARPQSASGIIQNTSSSHQFGQPSGAGRIHRNSYHGISASAGSNIYRGQSSGAPIQPYAFTSTPALTGLRQQPPHLRPDQRTMSAPSNTNTQAAKPMVGLRNARYPAPASVSTTTSSSSSDVSGPTTRDDNAEASIMTAQVATRARPPSTIITSPLAAGTTSASKPAPDRYRRTANRRNDSQGSNQTPTGTAPAIQSGWNIEFDNSLQLAEGLQMPTSVLQPLSPNMRVANTSTNGQRGAFDDMNIRKLTNQEERNRRRSIHTIDATFITSEGLNKYGPGNYAQQFADNTRPNSSPEKKNNMNSVLGRSASSPAITAPKRESTVLAVGTNPAPRTTTSDRPTTTSNNVPQSVTIPARGSSSDATKRATISAPLNKQTTMSNEPAVTKDSFASTVTAALQTPAKHTEVAPNSPAAVKLAALNDTKPSKKPSRLRRAFSFGSAAELRKASGDNGAGAAADRARLRKEQFQNEQDAEQARIARKQEEGGIGSGIYSGQGNVFGSTDNLSISSTASSASIMIRKMGKGMKKSTRSLVGLFRPKSVVGVPAADAPVQASTAEISMVTVEAERQRVNVTGVPYDIHGAGTGFPKLERNSIDAANAVRPSGSTEQTSFDSAQRKSILGGERERAEVLAAVKKGILKRSATDSASSSPVVQPADTKSANFGLPQIPHVDDSPASSAPSTPKDESGGHRRTDSVTLNGEDYFMSALRFSGSKSTPATPAAKRNISWKNTTNYHDTWASTEYDRRGEIATCNRLTPMLAQQIKEELNSFKMEMEVHENSKIYTHFF